MLFLWGYINKKGAWISCEKDFLDILKGAGHELPDKIHGDSKLNELLEGDSSLTAFLIKHFKEIICEQTL